MKLGTMGTIKAAADLVDKHRRSTDFDAVPFEPQPGDSAEVAAAKIQAEDRRFFQQEGESVTFEPDLLGPMQWIYLHGGIEYRKPSDPWPLTPHQAAALVEIDKADKIRWAESAAAVQAAHPELVHFTVEEEQEAAKAAHQTLSVWRKHRAKRIEKARRKAEKALKPVSEIKDIFPKSTRLPSAPQKAAISEVERQANLQELQRHVARRSRKKSDKTISNWEF